MAMVFITYLGAAMATINNGNTRIDFFIRKLPTPDGRSWRSGQFGRSFCSQGSGMKDISEGFRGKPLICSLLGSYYVFFLSIG
jgi:hypothetical protein